MLYSAYNEGSKRFLSPRLSVVDAEREPLKVLKIMMEGLAASARNGIWLINFRGIPVARSHSAFDLVYLDDEHRVVHAIEISQSSEFTPFKGNPSSALILPATSLIRSKTFTGDRLTLSEAGHPAAEQATPAPKRVAAPKQSRVVPAHGGKTFNVPAPAQVQDLRAPAAAMSSGRLMRSGSLALKRSPETMPSISPAMMQDEQPAAEAKVVPISVPNEQAQEVSHTISETMPQRKAPEAAVTALAMTGRTRAVDEERATAYSADAAAAEVLSPRDGEMPAASETALQPKKAVKTPAEYKKKDEAGNRKSWDVQLLYSLFPELDPSYRPEFQAPVVNFTKDLMQPDEERLSKKVQILSWFYPDLELETVHKRQREHRRAPRIPVPGLVGYYFAGGHSQPHEVRNLSVMGFYMVTNERWMPGTVIRVTLQIVDSPGDDPRDTLTVLSRVVNWGPDGGGFEFVMPGFVD